MDNESGGLLSGKVMGIPTIIVVLAVAAVGYFLFMRNSGSQPANETTGGGGSVTTGATNVKKGAVTINVKQSGGQPSGQPEDQDQPAPPVPDKTKEHTRQITVGRNETLAQLAKQYHWTAATLKAVENQNELGGHGHLTPHSKLHKGQTIIRPIK